ncbi:alpha/beta-hydrolase family protein [Corynebacterium glucuronolyticum]|uniref:alpha/beta-hydrolase family protein n=1 Tax=Corynebacterium glucuronolyticum TaxID=39791 RepID=UPI0019201B12|nr:alpha/beta-hydrolase family protein [Corynebacterium glucuronolyticum]QQU88591.1 alpha/beta-hydrolase family protein [Corynebacterium glucuronolyticum]
MRLFRRGALLGAEIGTWAALSPSLLPRRMWQTALNVAGCQAAGHAIAAGIYRSVGGFPVPHRVVAGITGFAFVRSIFRQNEIADLVESPRPAVRDTAVGAVLGTAGYAECVLVGEVMKAQFGWVRGLIRRAFPRRPRVPVPALSALAITATTWLIGTRFLIVRRLAPRITQKAEELNLFINPKLPRPTSPLRSGSPDSLMSWESLGAKGRDFVTASPSPRKLGDARGDVQGDVQEPIRIYGGIDATVEDILAEMDRTGAWERDYIIVHISTGTGWVNPWHVAAPEILTGGNVASVSMQYSYLQSPITYVADRSTPVDAARELLSAILDRRSHGVYIAGESLGAYGAASNDDLLERVDGAVFTGTPRFTPIITRVSSTPHSLPVVDGGAHIRFVATPAHLTTDWRGMAYEERWATPRICFVQHPSDPVAFFDWPIFFLPPRWMKDHLPGADRTPALVWWPLFTGWQLLVDMPISHRQTGGHGHTYHEELIPVWRAVLGLDD